MRRLLENGANTSFVNRIVDESLPVEEVVGDPVADVERAASGPHPRIPLPRGLFGAERRELRRASISPDGGAQRRLAAGCREALAQAPGCARRSSAGAERDGETPRNAVRRRTSRASWARPPMPMPRSRTRAIGLAAAAQPDWDRVPAATRARILRDAADRLERETRALRRASASPKPARRCRTRSPRCARPSTSCATTRRGRRSDFGRPLALPGPTGERTGSALRGRGVFACISPWNFPLAIFTGQVAAALAAGNTVIAKPAEQTPLVAARDGASCCTRPAFPATCCTSCPARGSKIGPALTGDPRIAGVAFTGSTETARPSTARSRRATARSRR